jgi:hypothetical protein
MPCPFTPPQSRHTDRKRKPILQALLGLLLAHGLSAGEVEHWIQTPQIEAGFAVENGLRLEVLRIPGGDNILRGGETVTRGIKTWVMAPHDIGGVRDMLSEIPGQLEADGDHSLRLWTEPEPGHSLWLEWEVRVRPDEPVLEITHRIHNTGAEPFHGGIWILAAYEPRTLIEVPFDKRPHIPGNYPNPVYIWPWSDIGDDRIASNDTGFLLDIRRGPYPASFKGGLVAHHGTFRATHAGQVMESTVAHDPTAHYPEGGANLTVFASPGNSDGAMGEGEHVGPLVWLEPDASIEQHQVIRIGRAPGK